MDEQRVVNVADYGAKAEPGFDNRPAIQAAIDELNKYGGGVLLIPSGAGTYEIYAPLIIDSTLTVKGEGKQGA